MRHLCLLVTIGALLSPAMAQDSDKQPPKQEARSHPLTNDQLGIEFAVTSSKIRRAIIRTKTPYGFAVRKVAEGSLADDAEIKKGTIVLEVDGKPLREVSELEAVLKNAKPGQKLVLKCSDRKKNRRLGDRKPWVERKVEIVLPKKKDGVELPKLIGEIRKG